MENRRKTLTRYAIYLAIVVALGSCASGDDLELSGQDVATRLMPIDQEHMGRAELATRRYNDPEIAMASYTVPTIWGCTGTMIGPNVLMTAAHCGDSDRRVTFLTYRNSHYHPQSPGVLTGDSTNDTEDFSCRFLINSFPRSDVALYCCDPNGGVHPGDKYGYLDFDVTQPSVGQQVYSVIAHSVDTPRLTDARLWTAGSVETTNHVIWPPGDSSSPITEPIGIGMDIFGEPGVSGSSTLNPASHRILVGPTSTTSSSWRKYALSMHDYLREATFNGMVDDQGVYQPAFDAQNLATLGLNGWTYWGAVDKNVNFLFDIQEDLERLRGENQRDWYHLGFESERRRTLWETPEGVNYVAGAAHMIALPDSPYVIMRHRRLNLKADTTYRVSMRVRTISSADDKNLRLELVREVGGNLILDDTASIDTIAGVGWTTATASLRTAGQDTQLVIASPHPMLNVFISSLTVVEVGAVMDFDSHDKRYGWRDGNTGLRGRVLPDGRTAGTPNWAGFVHRDRSRPANDDWSLSNPDLPLPPSTVLPYRICFDVLRNTPAVYGPTDYGVIRVVNAGNEVVRAEFAPTSTWQAVCTGSFRVSQGGSEVMFGNQAAAPSASIVPSYLVDNLRVETVVQVVQPEILRPKPIILGPITARVP